MRRRNRRYKTFIFGIIIGYFLSSYINNMHTGSENRVVSTRKHVALQRSVDMDMFWDVWDLVNQEYISIEEVEDKEDRVEGAINGMLGSLDDPYTLFMGSDEAGEFEQSLNGELEGIGAEITKKNGVITVLAPLKNSPAINAGLLPGDIIATIDGELTDNLSLYEAVSKIKGKRDTKVVLEIIRKNESELLTFEITRKTVHFDSVEWEFKDNLAYIEVSQFDDNTFKQMGAAINDIILAKPDGLILDLRGNTGGYLDVAVDMLSEFTDEKKIAVLIKSRNEEDNETLYTSGRARLADIPVVVLVNGSSASASEIVAGAIQDWNRGVLIGTTTYGKGSVQELRSLDGGAMLRLTIAKWNTPNDHNINKEGISPDIEIELTKEDYDSDLDPQLDKAIEYLNNL